MKKIGRKLLAKTKKNSNYILAAGAVIGLGATVYFVAKGQMRADEILAKRKEEADPEIEEVLTKKELLKMTWKCYIPAAISTGATLFCIVGSTYISAKQIAALTASVAAIRASRDQLEQAIREKYGDEALVELKKKMTLFKPEKEVVIIKTTAEETGNGDLLCFEGYSGRWFRSSPEAVKKAIDELEDQIRRYDCASLNDFYRFLGIEETHFGNEHGWIDYEYDSCVEEYRDGDDWMPIRIETFQDFDWHMGEDVLYMDIYTYPIESYYEY